MHRAPAQDGGDGGEILERRVDRAADAHLLRRRPDGLAHRHHVAGRRRQCDQRLQLAELDRLLLVVDRAWIGRQLDELVLPPLGGQPRRGPLVAGEDPGRGPRFHDHVADGSAVGRAQRGHALPVELEDPAPAAAYATPPEQLEHDVLRLHPVRQGPAQLDPDHDGLLDRVRAPRHRDRHLGRARADREHAESAGHGRVAVSADEHPARPREPLEVEIVRDPVAGA